MYVVLVSCDAVWLYDGNRYNDVIRRRPPRIGSYIYNEYWQIFQFHLLRRLFWVYCTYCTVIYFMFYCGGVRFSSAGEV